MFRSEGWLFANYRDHVHPMTNKNRGALSVGSITSSMLHGDVAHKACRYVYNPLEIPRCENVIEQFI